MKCVALLLALGGAAVGSLAAGTAFAASPGYCALYAREYAVDTVQPNAAPGMLQSVQDQAYYRCLNEDEDPPLPRASAYFESNLTKPGAKPSPAASAIVDAQPGAASASLSTTQELVPPPPSLRPEQPAQPKRVVTASNSRSASGYRGSGLQPWTPEWQAWCARNFPNSWDAKSGTILHYGSDTREQCK